MEHFNIKNYCPRDERQTRKAKRGKDIKKVERQKQSNNHHNKSQKDTERNLDLMRLRSDKVSLVLGSQPFVNFYDESK